jgi:hypothetical protein
MAKPSKYDPKPGDPEGKILAFDGTDLHDTPLTANLDPHTRALYHENVEACC